MIFNEIYSAYYNAVANIISKLTEGNGNASELSGIVSEYAFGESALTILPALKNGRWHFLTPDMKCILDHPPTTPLSDIQKQWLKAISMDERIALFDITFEGLEDTEPLFTTEDYIIYDKYGDGDNFSDEMYISHFRTILAAINGGHNLKLNVRNRRGEVFYIKCIPEKLEYSEKDDKFRLIVKGGRYANVINLANIVKCEAYYGEVHPSLPANGNLKEQLKLKITDERNCLERCLMHFAYLEKSVTKTADDEYILNISYNTRDVSEMVISVLSFGPTLEVLEPESFKELIKNKLISQKNYGLL